MPDAAKGTPLEMARQSQNRAAGNPDLRLGRTRLTSGGATGLPIYMGLLFGAVHPARETGAALVLPTVNNEAMSLHLAEISRQVASGVHAILILDGAGWHKAGGALAIPENIALLPLPPYAPEMSPIENIWQSLRQNDLCHTV